MENILCIYDVLTTVVCLSLVFMLIQHIYPLVPSWLQSIIPWEAEGEGLGSFLGVLVASLAEDWAARGSIHTASHCPDDCPVIP